MAVFDSYSSRSGEIFFNEIYKSSKQINSQKSSQSILFMCRAKFGTNQSMFSKIYRYFWRFSTRGKAASKLHLGVSMQVVIHTKFAFSRLEQYDYCYKPRADGEGTNSPRLFTPGETKSLAKSKVHQISRAWVTNRGWSSSLISKKWRAVMNSEDCDWSNLKFAL